MLVYISGNALMKELLTRAELWLRLNKHKAINFAKIVDNIAELTYEQQMKIKYLLIEMSEAIFMVDGWQKSKSAHTELAYAKSLGKKVLYQDYFKEFRKNEKRDSDGEQ